MNSHVRIALIIVILGMLGISGSKLIMPLLQDNFQTGSSDARDTKGKIKIGFDNWVGYFPLCSPEMKKRLRQLGYLLECIEDGADYNNRLSNLAAGKLDFAVATVDSYILNGDKHDYPGVIVATIDESKGGDAIVAWHDQLKSLDDFKQQQNIKIAFTPDSPSDHLLKAISVHFDISQLRQQGQWRVETQGSEQALKLLLKKEVNAAVLWEPDVSKALKQNGIKRIIGTEDTNQLIVDILLANRKIAQKKPELVEILLNSYFKTLKHYRNNDKQLISDIAETYKLDKKTVNTLLNGVAWTSLLDNADRWFSITDNALPEDALIETIESSINILTDYGEINQNPLPNQDPYIITNSTFVRNLYERHLSTQAFAPTSAGQTSNTNSLTKTFPAISKRGWRQLHEVGTLKIRPIVFASGTHTLTDEGKQQLSQATENLKHYPNYRVEIRGHTGTRGDKQLNEQLSSDRAKTVLTHLQNDYGIDKNRLRAIGFGGSQPLARASGESSRAYNYRLPRVELVLLAEEF